MAMRNDLRSAVVKLGEMLLFIVLLLAGLWIVLFLVKLAGWWEWFESGPDGPVMAATLPTLAALLIAVVFVHDRILRRAGVRPAEPAAVTVRKALREMAVQAGKGLLFTVLLLPWFAVWSVLMVLTGVRAAMYQNLPVSVAATLIGAVVSAACAWFIYEWIMRKLWARGWLLLKPEAREKPAPEGAVRTPREG